MLELYTVHRYCVQLTQIFSEVIIYRLQCAEYFKFWLWKQPKKPLSDAFFCASRLFNHLSGYNWLGKATHYQACPFHAEVSPEVRLTLVEVEITDHLMLGSTIKCL